MFIVNYNDLEGIFDIHNEYNVSATASEPNATPYFNNIGDEVILSFTNLQNIKKLTKFSYDTIGKTDNRFLEVSYRLSRNETTWSDWFELQETILNFPPIDPMDPLFIDIKFIRSGTNNSNTIRLTEYRIEGELDQEISTGSLVLTPGASQIIKPPYIYKVFKLTGIEVISATGYPDDSIKWRYSQDNSRTWSVWEPLTNENISTKRLTPTRFFQVEYLVENTTNGVLKIQDINLLGNFQNVSLDYQKTNLYGIRECCQSNLNGSFDENGNFIPNTNLNQGLSNGAGANCDSTSLYSTMTPDELANLYSPYSQNSAVALLNKLSNDAQQVFGHPVIYFATDADAKGQDFTMHEYQLYNIVCKADLKVSVVNNEFPDSQITMNQFDLNLFDTMEVHVTKQQFKQLFGPQRRPSKEDFLYFCTLNRMYKVDHSTQFRGFNNTAVYYKLILKKYNTQSNVKAGNQEIQNQLDMLTQNSTVDSLFGVENTLDKMAVANKSQYRVLTKDPIRMMYYAKIDRELVENSTTIISKTHYDLYSIGQDNVAIEYFNLDPVLKVSDNLGYMMWFNINNYVSGDIFNFISYYDNDNQLGWKANLSDDVITVTLNSDTYTFDVTLDEDVWYCYVLNFDQRQRNIEQYIYKRDTDFEEDASRLTSTILRQLNKNVQTMRIVEYELEDINPTVLGCDMKMTNIRLFSDVIPESEHNKILNQTIIGDDSKYLVFGDNANTRLYLPNLPLNE